MASSQVLSLVGHTLLENVRDDAAPPVAMARFGSGTLLFTAQVRVFLIASMAFDGF